MAIAFSAASNNSAIGTTVSVSHTAAGSDRIALIGVYQATDHTITALSYGAQTPTLIATNGRAHLYRQVAPTTGAQTVAVISNASGGLVLGVLSYTGVDQTTPIGTHQVASNTEQVSIASPAVTSSASGLVVDLCILIVDAMSPDSGQTQRMNLAAGGTPPTGHDVGYFSFGMSDEVGSASVVTGWSAAGTVGDNVLIAVPLIAAAGGGASQAPRSSGIMRMLMNN